MTCRFLDPHNPTPPCVGDDGRCYGARVFKGESKPHGFPRMQHLTRCPHGDDVHNWIACHVPTPDFYDMQANTQIAKIREESGQIFTEQASLLSMGGESMKMQQRAK